jgi:hypothetical protein
MAVTTLGKPPAVEPPTPSGPRRVSGGLLDPQQLWRSTPDALRKLNPWTLWRNPVMFIVEIGSVFTTVLAVVHPTVFAWLITVWLWLTVVFANLAEAVAEGRGKAQAEALRRAKTDTVARRLVGWQPGATDLREEEVPAPRLQQGDVVVVEAGQTIPGDGDVVEGIASVDESAITGESAPVIRESGGDRSAVTGGTKVLSDRIVVRITQKPGESFIDRMIALVEGANRQKTPNEIALNILLAALTIIFVLAVATLQPLAIYSKAVQAFAPDNQALDAHGVTGIVLVSLLVCLIPTTIGALLSAIGIAGMDRLVQRNVLAMSGRAVEAAGDVNTLLLDKTGTITLGNRQASQFLPVGGITPAELADAAQLSSLAHETPEGCGCPPPRRSPVTTAIPVRPPTRPPCTASTPGGTSRRPPPESHHHDPGPHRRRRAADPAALRINLTARRYEVVTAADGTHAIKAAGTEHPDLIVLDLGLPDLDGTQVIRSLRCAAPASSSASTSCYTTCGDRPTATRPTTFASTWPSCAESWRTIPPAPSISSPNPVWATGSRSRRRPRRSGRPCARWAVRGTRPGWPRCGPGR